MKKYPTFVLTLTALVLLFMLGRFLVRQANRGEWTVEVEREDAPSASVSAESGWPESLLEGERININAASAADLQRLPGIGAERAQAIVTERQEGGAFEKADDLLRVSGIGAGLLERLRPYVTVGEN